MTALPIFASDDVRSGWATDSVLASLPLSFRPSDRLTGGVAVVGGADGWPEAVASAIASGAAGVIVVAPEPADLTALNTLERWCPVVIDSVWASNPVIPVAAAAVRSATSGVRLECRVVVGTKRSLTAALLDQLSLVRALASPANALRILHWSDHGYSAQAETAAIPVDLSATTTDAVAEQALVRLITADGSVEVKIPAGETAQPAVLTLTGPDGTTFAPTLYESSHRATWRRLHRLLTDHESASDVDDLDADIRAASH